MSRLPATIQKDTIIQARNQFYTISLGLAILFSIVFSLILRADQIKVVVPAAVLLIVGGTTFIFVGGLIIDEKEKGILKALLLSPLSTGEYLWSKILTLTFLATLEVGIMVGGPIAYFNYRDGTGLPNVLILALGIVALNLIYTLLGIGTTVRFRKITDYMIPVVMIMIVLQLPILYYANILRHPALLVIPSSAPVMLIQGAFAGLGSFQWVYAAVYTTVLLVLLTWWAMGSYRKYVVLRME